MNSPKEYDVVIIGASIAGCTAAILYAKQGLKVCLIERESNLQTYKKICTHFIQASATPTIQRLGIADLIEKAGGIRNSIEIWTRWGWIRNKSDPQEHYPTYGYSLRRERLDPLLKSAVRSTPGVELQMGQTLKEMIFDQDRVVGVVVENQEGRKKKLELLSWWEQTGATLQQRNSQKSKQSLK